MSDIPDEAVDAAARVLEPEFGAPTRARQVVEAAYPIIAAQATADLHARIETLRDEWQANADAAFAAFPNPIGTRDGFSRGYASATSVHADALAALIGGA